jgi:predicted CxxxxCH...CXXCH cytochrome family protein
MKTDHPYLIGLLALPLAFLPGCADLKSDLPIPVSPGVVAHPAGITDTASADFHGTLIRGFNWDMRSCQKCHGNQFDGGTVDASCRDCHSGPGGPENCSTCHGSSNPAPPRDLGGNTSASARGVGAHQVHVGLYPATISACDECHLVPGPTYDPRHIDTSPGAEVRFNGPFGKLVTGRGTRVPNPAYNTTTLRCGNTFCHGDFKSRRVDADTINQYAYVDSIMLGALYAPLWTGGAAEAACGTCHGLPPAGHVAPLPLTTCGNSGCHPGVVNASGQIADRSKHMNGRINVRGTERSF